MTLNKNSLKPFGILIFGQAWDTFSYYGTQTILVLYAMHILHFNKSASYLLYGLYGMFNYAIPIFGGMVADHWLGSKKTLVLGYALNLVGNIILLCGHHKGFYLGLATSLIGSGIYKSTSTALIGSLYDHKTNQKQTAFTWSYLAVNFGGMLAPLVYGWGTYAISWHLAF